MIIIVNKEKGSATLAIKIFIDQGHNPTGNPNAGAVGNGLYEQDITYQVGIYLADLLNSNPNFEARLSRPTPETVLGTSAATSLAARVQMANEWPADYFLSIHVNSNENPAINGTEIYLFELGTEAQWLAEQIMTGITEMVVTRDNGIFVRPSLFVLRRTEMTALLIELAYISNSSDAVKLRDDQYQFAYGIYLGLLRYFGFA